MLIYSQTEFGTKAVFVTKTWWRLEFLKCTKMRNLALLFFLLTFALVTGRIPKIFFLTFVSFKNIYLDICSHNSHSMSVLGHQPWHRTNSNWNTWREFIWLLQNFWHLFILIYQKILILSINCSHISRKNCEWNSA